MNPNTRKSPHGEKGGDRPSLREWMATKLDVPAELVDGGIRMEMCGRYALSVHGCRRILEFTPERVVLELGNATLTVWGRRLICTAFLCGDVGVEGCIRGLCFDGEEEERAQGSV